MARRRHGKHAAPQFVLILKAKSGTVPDTLGRGTNKERKKGKGPAEKVDEDLKKPYKEVLKSPFTKRIIVDKPRRMGNANIMYNVPAKRLEGPARGWFDRMPNGCIDGWTDLHEKFTERFALRRRCSKDPTEVSKIVRKANETLSDFKERWTEEMGYI
ncbi:reverse transcriptase domain-containing protein [Tanacetum coccineum]